MKHVSISGFLGLVVALSSSLAWAAGEVEMTLTAEKEIQVAQADGSVEVKRVELDKAVPGDTVVYTTTYRNISAVAVDAGAGITNEIPNNILYVEGSAQCDQPCQVLFSVNGSDFAPKEALTVLDEEGNTVPASAKDFTRLRWVIQDAIAPAATGQVMYKAKIKTLEMTEMLDSATSINSER